MTDFDRDELSTLERAIVIATEAHSGHRDKAGECYILHSFRVMLSVTTVTERIAAVLHDVVEDSPWTIEDLRHEGFDEDVLEALDRLTKREGEDYRDFVRRAAGHPISRAVKRADLMDNLDLSRIAEPTAKDRERAEKYRCALTLLDGSETG